MVFEGVGERQQERVESRLRTTKSEIDRQEMSRHQG